MNTNERLVEYSIVLYGVPGAGKRTTLRRLYQSVIPEMRGDLLENVGGDPQSEEFTCNPYPYDMESGFTLKCTYLTARGPLEQGSEAEKRVLGAAALIFVVDSGLERLDAHRKALETLDRAIMQIHSGGLHDYPWILQINKCDLSQGRNIELMKRELDRQSVEIFESNATGSTSLDYVRKAIHHVLRDYYEGRNWKKIQEKLS